jgi:hypothetical protein
MMGDTLPARIEDALDLPALSHQLSETARRARQAMRSGYLTEGEITELLWLVEQADRLAGSIEAIRDAQRLTDALRQAQRDGVLAWDRLRREFAA